MSNLKIELQAYFNPTETKVALHIMQEWLTQKLKDNGCCSECDIINTFVKTELLEDLK